MKPMIMNDSQSNNASQPTLETMNLTDGLPSLQERISHLEQSKLDRCVKLMGLATSIPFKVNFKESPVVIHGQQFTMEELLSLTL